MLSRGPTAAVEEAQARPAEEEEVLHCQLAEQRQTLGRLATVDTAEALCPAAGTEALICSAPTPKQTAAAAAAEALAQALKEEALRQPLVKQRQTLDPPGASKTRIFHSLAQTKPYNITV
ncbi:UNVERIFIED_CONTAM: hypothetical protein K2H54_038149 [Gekko kuhli]